MNLNLRRGLRIVSAGLASNESLERTAFILEKVINIDIAIYTYIKIYYICKYIAFILDTLGFKPSFGMVIFKPNNAIVGENTNWN